MSLSKWRRIFLNRQVGHILPYQQYGVQYSYHPVSLPPLEETSFYSEEENCIGIPICIPDSAYQRS